MNTMNHFQCLDCMKHPSGRCDDRIKELVLEIMKSDQRAEEKIEITKEQVRAALVGTIIPIKDIHHFPKIHMDDIFKKLGFKE